VRFLLTSRADVRCDKDEPGFNSIMQAWTTAYVNPAEHEAEARAKLRLLLEYNADVQARIAHTGETALHWAAMDFQRRRSEGASARINRWTTNRTECAKMKFLLLLQAGADPLVRNRRNQTALDLVSPNFRSELPSQENACREPL
jgi:ankyrin repeat protein